MPNCANPACGHSKEAHEVAGLEPQCTASGCVCVFYREPRPVPAPPRVVTTGAPPTVEQLIDAGRRSENKRISALADKVAGSAAELRALLREEQATAEIRREIADLEQKLATAKAKLRGTAKPVKASVKAAAAPAPAAAEKVKCPSCNDEVSARGLGPHRAKKHGYRRPAKGAAA